MSDSGRLADRVQSSMDPSIAGEPVQRGRRPPPTAHRSATQIAYVLAAWTTVLSFLFVKDMPGSTAWAGWYVFAPVAVACGWLGAWAWARRRWALALVGFLGVLLAPWGVLFVGPIAAVPLAISALVALVRRVPQSEK